MDFEEIIRNARKNIQQLVEKINPITGEPLPQESVLRHNDILFSLARAINAMKFAEKYDYNNDGLYDIRPIKVRQQDNIDNRDLKNAGVQWTDEMNKHLTLMDKHGMGVDDIAEILGRTGHAVSMQLKKLKLSRKPSESLDFYVQFEDVYDVE